MRSAGAPFFKNTPRKNCVGAMIVCAFAKRSRRYAGRSSMVATFWRSSHAGCDSPRDVTCSRSISSAIGLSWSCLKRSGVWHGKQPRPPSGGPSHVVPSGFIRITRGQTNQKSISDTTRPRRCSTTRSTRSAPRWRRWKLCTTSVSRSRMCAANTSAMYGCRYSMRRQSRPMFLQKLIRRTGRPCTSSRDSRHGPVASPNAGSSENTSTSCPRRCNSRPTLSTYCSVPVK